MTFTNEGKLILSEVKTYSFFRLIETSGDTLSAALKSGSLFHLLRSKKYNWSTAVTIAESDDRGWISEPESFTFNDNSKWTGLWFDSLVFIC